MRRWNGWGDDSITYPLSSSAASFLESQLGKSFIPDDASLDEMLAQVPKSRLPDHKQIHNDAVVRLNHARGQSFSDWVEIRSGRIKSFPDGVAFPTTDEEIADLITLANKKGFQVIPYGGGTSVVGHINPLKDKMPILTIDLSRMNRLIDLDRDNLLATFGAGICGPDLEAQLRAHGFTLGHFPQSFEFSTLGGWVATRSSGQQSLRYGRIEKLFAGGRMQTPQGELVLPSFPASAAGPDMREMVLGSEGRMGILSEVQVRISRISEAEEFHAIFFHTFNDGIQAVRQILSSGITCCMLRLSTSNETTTTLALAGHERLIGALEKLLAMRGIGDGKCMLLLGFSGLERILKTNRSEAMDIGKKWGGVHVGKTFGEQWHKNRFRTPYLRNTLWERGYGVDTFETATGWGNTPRMVEQIESGLQGAIESRGGKAHIFTHLSHVYPQGSSVYTTVIFKLSDDPDDTLEQWREMKTAACQAIVSNGGTISHQHGVGVDHLPYLSVEKGKTGMEAIRAVIRQFDPNGIMNPGKLIK